MANQDNAMAATAADDVSIRRSKFSALRVRRRWCEEIFDHGKTWDLRGAATRRRGLVHIAELGTGGKIVGQVEIVECLLVGVRWSTPGRFKWSCDRTMYHLQDKRQAHLLFTLADNFRYHRVPFDELHKFNYKNVYAWVLRSPVRYLRPVPFEQAMGCVTWVSITGDVVLQAKEACEEATRQRNALGNSGPCPASACSSGNPVTN